MKVRADVIKVYKDVHIWVGILSGLMLFIAFYAGAITMFEKPLERWATPPTSLSAPPPLEQADALVAALLAQHPEAAQHYVVMVQPTPEFPARVIWRQPGETRRQFVEYGVNWGADGQLEIEKLQKAPVAQLIDTLHQEVGLPFPATVSNYIMGTVAMLYAMALISGLIVVLPTLTKDLFALRLGKNIKRMWMDVHNALGIVSLPFHIVIALTSVVFAFHDPFYDTQGQVVYGQGMPWEAHEAPLKPNDGVEPLTVTELLQRINSELPEFEVFSLTFRTNRELMEADVTGLDTRYGTRARTSATAHIDPYTGQLDPHDLPGHMDSWSSTVNTFFMLHFGSYGGNSMRWIYFLMGLAGALLFYTGNVLWLESRRKKARDGTSPQQSRATRILGSLTIGVSLGCVMGISTTLAATKWLPSLVHNLAAWHESIYFAVFAGAVIWAFYRGAARAAAELLYAAAALTLLIPLGSLAGLWHIAGTWNHSGPYWTVDLIAVITAVTFYAIARKSSQRSAHGHRDSVWSAAPEMSTQT